MRFIMALFAAGAILAQQNGSRPYDASTQPGSLTPFKGANYVPGAAIINSLGKIDAATGTGTNCVLVNGTSSVCGGSWGNITGLLSSQLDLKAALDAKQVALGFTPENIANKNANNGYPGLNSSGLLLTAQFPATIGSNTTGSAAQWGGVTITGTQTPGFVPAINVAGAAVWSAPTGGANAAAVVTATYGSTPAFTCTSATLGTSIAFQLSATLSSNITPTISGCTPGQIVTFKYVQNGTGGFTVTQPAGFNCPVTLLANAETDMFYVLGAGGTPVYTACTGPQSTCLISAAPGAAPPSGQIYSWCDSTGLIPRWENSGGTIFQASKELTAGSVRAAGGANAPDTIANAANIGSPSYGGSGGGTANAQTVTLSPAVASLASITGVTIKWLPTAANTTATPTLAVNGLTATTITKCHTSALLANDILTTEIALVQYNGTTFDLLNPQAVGCGAGGSSPTAAPGFLLFGNAGDTVNNTTGLIPAASGSANSGLFIIFSTPPGGYSGSHISYQVVVAAGSGTNGFLQGIFSADNLYAPLCVSSVATGTNITGVTFHTVTWASGNDVSGGVCTLPPGTYLWAGSSSDTTLSILSSASSNGVGQVMNQNASYFAGGSSGGGEPFVSGSGSSISFVSSATFIGYGGYIPLGAVFGMPVIFADK